MSERPTISGTFPRYLQKMPYPSRPSSVAGTLRPGPWSGVVPIAQKQTVGEITVALTALEIHGEGLGVLRYRISYAEAMFEGGYGIPVPELVIQNEAGSGLPWSWRNNGSSDGESYGEVDVTEIPDAGEIAIEAPRVASWRFDDDAGEEVEEEAYDGPWSFRFSL